MFALLSVVLIAGPEPLAQDTGAAGTWQRLLKLQTLASAMHTTAHPDDEHGGMLAQLSRGEGVRVSLLTLNRGESGDNAVGPELFDALGLIRTEELLLAGRYYGLDRQYFTTAIDYGFSKVLEEALVKWGRENVLRDMVRVIRTDRPLVLISRFQGNARDGHGNHEAAGILTQEAYRVAGDAAVFPEQIRDGLRPWQPLKLYMGGVRETEDWTLRVDTGEYSPWLGESYQSFARLGLAFQRSQNGGRVGPQNGSSISYYKRLDARVNAPARERSFFDGIDTTIPGLFSIIRRPAPAGAAAAVERDCRQRARCDGRLLDGESVSVRAGAGEGSDRDAHRDRRAGGGTRRGVRSADQGTAVHGRDQHRARPRVRGDGVGRSGRTGTGLWRGRRRDEPRPARHRPRRHRARRRRRLADSADCGDPGPRLDGADRAPGLRRWPSPPRRR